MTLTNKQEAFCREYLIDLNATQAAIRAGYSEKTASTIASENLIKPNVQKKIQLLMEQVRVFQEPRKTGLKLLRLVSNIWYWKVASITTPWQ